MSTLEGLYKAGNYAAARREFLRLVSGLWDGPPEEEAQLWLLGGQTYLRLRDLFSAAQTLGEAHALALRADAWNLVGEIRYFLGFAYEQLGDAEEARNHLTSFLIDLRMYPAIEPRFHGPVHFALGLVHTQRRDPETALAHYQLAEPLLARTGSLPHLVQLCHNSAWILFDLARFSEADSYLARATSSLSTLDLQELSESHTVVQAYGHLRRGNLKVAIELCETVLHPSSDPSLKNFAWATWIGAECALRSGQLREAGLLANSALDSAIRLRNARLMNLVNETRRKLVEHDED